MKKVLFIFVALVAIFLGKNASAQKLEFFGAGLATKFHHVEVLESEISESTIGASVEFGHEFEGHGHLAKSLTGELFLGSPLTTLKSPSFNKGFATEFVLKFGLETHAENPLGAYAGVSIGHISALPVIYVSDKNSIVSRFGEEGYHEFSEMAKNKERMVENYSDVEVGASYELDGLKFELGYGLIHHSIGISMKYNLRI